MPGFAGVEVTRLVLKRQPHSAGATGRVARRTKLGDDGNQMQADGNSFPVFILGWTIGAISDGEVVANAKADVRISGA